MGAAGWSDASGFGQAPGPTTGLKSGHCGPFFLGANVGRASGNDCYIVIEHGPWKIVDLPIKDGDFP